MRAILILFAAMVASPALADPCEARVTGYKAGATVAGTARYVGDGDMVCVGAGKDPATWTEVRLADFYAPELSERGGRKAKADLARLVMGKRLVCTATKGARGRTYHGDRLIAVCTLRGRPLGDLLRRAGATEGGNGYSRAR